MRERPRQDIGARDYSMRKNDNKKTKVLVLGNSSLSIIAARVLALWLPAKGKEGRIVASRAFWAARAVRSELQLVVQQQLSGATAKMPPEFGPA